MIKKCLSKLLLFSFLSASVILSTFSEKIIISAEENIYTFAGGEPLSLSEYNRICNELESTEGSEISAFSILQPSVDLSTSVYFPPIGNQGPYNSCVAWASTYYQFTYEMNRLHNTSYASAGAYSPSWTWNFLNESQNIGTWYGDAYKVLSTFGAEKIYEMEYDINNYDYSWSTNTEYMMNALNSRLTRTSAVSISGSGTEITNNKDSDLNSVKQLLSDGKVLTVMTRMWGDPETPLSTVICRGNDLLASWHALTIVGYDDNFTYDINNNGIIEEFEKGAFKAANSWGLLYGNLGYNMIMYDALNGVSASPTSWENNQPGNRCAIFDVDPSPEWSNVNNQNLFFYITVEDRNVNMVGELKFNTNYRNSLDISIQHRGQFSADNYTKIYPIRSRGYYNNDVSQAVTLLLDYGNCYNGDNPYNYYQNNNWYVKFGNSISNVNNWINSGVSYKIVDNKYNTIKSFNTTYANSSSSTLITNKSINLTLGDLNYNSQVEINDVAILQQHLYGGLELSNVQKRLADCDSNEIINEADKSIMLGLCQ